MRAVAETVRHARAGLAEPDRPLGSFLFMGPTGVGKTELVKALAERLFATEQARSCGSTCPSTASRTRWRG